MEGLQFQRHLVNPRAALLDRDGVVELRVEGQHVQLHLHAIDHLHRINHVLNELGVRGTGRMHTHHDLRLLGFLLVGALGLHQLAIGVDGFLAHLVGLDDGSRQQLIQARGKALSASRVAVPPKGHRSA